MKSKKLGLFLTLALVLTGAFAFAQDAPKEESPVKVSGLFFNSFNMGAGGMDKMLPATSLGSFYFGFERIQVRVDAKLSKNFSYYVSLDALPLGPSQVGAPAVLVRNSFLRANGGLDGMLNVNFDFGILNTVIMANRNRMVDDRWLTAESYNANAGFLGSKMITAQGVKGVLTNNGDQASDIGAGICFKVLNMVEISFQVVSGEGFQDLGTDISALKAGKAWYGDIFVEPIKGLYITGFMRYENVLFINPYEPATTSPATSGGSSTGADDWYAGAGVGMNMKGIRAGVDFEIGQNIKKNMAVNSDYANNFFALNAWFNWNLNEIAGFPLLVLAKVSYGTLTTAVGADAYQSTPATSMNVAVAPTAVTVAKVNDTFYYYVGVGWQFNKNVRAALMFESYYYSAAEFAQAFNTTTDDTAFMDSRVMAYTGNNKLMLKVETKF